MRQLIEFLAFALVTFVLVVAAAFVLVPMAVLGVVGCVLFASWYTASHRARNRWKP